MIHEKTQHETDKGKVMRKKIATRIEQLIDNLHENLNEKIITWPITLRLPILNVAQIDILSSLKDVSRNTLLNEIVQTTLIELLEKLEEKNPQLAKSLQEKAQALAKNMVIVGEPQLSIKKTKQKKVI